MMTALHLATASTRRWERLTVLLGAMERCTEQAARLDAYRHRGQGPGVNHHADHLVQFNHRLEVLEARFDIEIDRLTVERLMIDLGRKRRVAADLAKAVDAALTETVPVPTIELVPVTSPVTPSVPTVLVRLPEAV